MLISHATSPSPSPSNERQTGSHVAARLSCLLFLSYSIQQELARNIPSISSSCHHASGLYIAIWMPSLKQVTIRFAFILVSQYVYGLSIPG